MATFIVNHPDFGWQAFGGNVQSRSPNIQVQLTDSVRRRVFIAPLGVLFSVDAGAFNIIEFSTTLKTVTLSLLPAPVGATSAAAAPNARIVVKQTATISGVGSIQPQNSSQATLDAGAYVIPFSSGTASITFTVS